MDNANIARLIERLLLNETTVAEEPPALVALQDIIRQYNANFTAYNQTINRALRIIEQRSPRTPPTIPDRTMPYTTSYFNRNRYTNRPQNVSRLFDAILRPESSAGLTDAQIQASTESIIYDISNTTLPTQCPISLEDFADGETCLQIRRCKHIFRPTQLRRWFQQHSVCPVCRGTVSAPAPSPPDDSSDTEYDDIPLTTETHPAYTFEIPILFGGNTFASLYS